MIYIFLAQGFEETEAIGAVDILRRGGIDIRTVGVEDRMVIGSHQIPIMCDLTISQVEKGNITGVILPGGQPGVDNLAKSTKLYDIIQYAYQNGLLMGAICAAPILFGRWGFLKNRQAVCYPGLEHELKGAKLVASAAVRDGNIITGKGPGATLDFALLIGAALAGERKMKEVKEHFMAGLL
jgi:4-methyl-5(b-hydroxyethyl)-thiazole monophosphate biosynthesis